MLVSRDDCLARKQAKTKPCRSHIIRVFLSLWSIKRLVDNFWSWPWTVGAENTTLIKICTQTIACCMRAVATLGLPVTNAVWRLSPPHARFMMTRFWRDGSRSMHQPSLSIGVVCVTRYMHELSIFTALNRTLSAVARLARYEGSCYNRITGCRSTLNTDLCRPHARVTSCFIQHEEGIKSFRMTPRHSAAKCRSDSPIVRCACKLCYVVPITSIANLAWMVTDCFGGIFVFLFLFFQRGHRSIQCFCMW